MPSVLSIKSSGFITVSGPICEDLDKSACFHAERLWPEWCIGPEVDPRINLYGVHSEASNSMRSKCESMEKSVLDDEVTAFSESLLKQRDKRKSTIPFSLTPRQMHTQNSTSNYELNRSRDYGDGDEHSALIIRRAAGGNSDLRREGTQLC